MAEEKKPWQKTKRLKKWRPKMYDWETSEIYDPMIRRRGIGHFNCEAKTKGQALIDLVDMYKDGNKGVTAVEFTYSIIANLWPGNSDNIISPRADQVIQILKILRAGTSKSQYRLLNKAIGYLKSFDPEEPVNYKNVDEKEMDIDSLGIFELVDRLSKDKCFSIVNLLTKVQLCDLYQYYYISNNLDTVFERKRVPGFEDME